MSRKRRVSGRQPSSGKSEAVSVGETASPVEPPSTGPMGWRQMISQALGVALYLLLAKVLGLNSV
ncbi:hypothetical protein ACFVVU_15060 [Kitasatospora sp. NPDC057965]|uniref:hypothetical protein n=1 Tax=Kitasatospora sp. NPDC057965 TaxID=3346291 RepID=UPI0036DCA9BE